MPVCTATQATLTDLARLADPARLAGLTIGGVGTGAGACPGVPPERRPTHRPAGRVAHRSSLCSTVVGGSAPVAVGDPPGIFSAQRNIGTAQTCMLVARAARFFVFLLYTKIDVVGVRRVCGRQGGPDLTVNKKSQCRDGLIARILRLDLDPGTELDETQIAAEYGLSRTPLREIFQGLAGEGYLQLEANRGARVTSLDLPVMRCFFQTAPLVYATMARLAAENRRSDDMRLLKEIQTRFLAATEGEDPAAAALENHAFHKQIGEMAGNPYLMPALNRMLIDHTRLSQTFYRPATKKDKKLVRKAAQQHDTMIAAIEGQAPDVAVDLTLQHWDLSRDQMERFVRPDPLPLDVVNFDAQRQAR